MRKLRRTHEVEVGVVDLHGRRVEVKVAEDWMHQVTDVRQLGERHEERPRKDLVQNPLKIIKNS